MILPRGEDEQFVELFLASCEREAVDVVVPTVDSELIPLAAPARSSRRQGCGSCSRRSRRSRCAWTSGHCTGAATARCARPTLARRRRVRAGIAPLPAIVKPRVGSGSRGIHRVDRVEQLESLERDGSLLVQELLPGPEYSLDVLATREGRVIAVVPRERLKIDSGIAVTGRTRHDERLRRSAARSPS